MTKSWTAGAMTLLVLCGASDVVNAQSSQQTRRTFGQRQVGIDPITGKEKGERRALLRINSRLNTRIQTRIDRFYGTQTDLRSSYTPKTDDTTTSTETTGTTAPTPSLQGATKSPQ